MSRKLFAFLLSELKVVRIICKSAQCGGIAELKIGRMGSILADPRCPICHQFLMGPSPDEDNPLTRLAKAIEEVKAHSAGLDLEFVIPDKSE